MKKLLVVLTMWAFFTACTSSKDSKRQESTGGQPPVQALTVPAAQSASFEDAVEGKSWKLAQAAVGGEDIGFTREKLAAEGFGDFFIMTFDDRLTGTAAPNRFSAPYKAEGQNLTLGLMVSTKMALLQEQKTLNEDYFFKLIEKTYKWEVKDGALQLFSKNEKGEITLTFTE